MPQKDGNVYSKETIGILSLTKLFSKHDFIGRARCERAGCRVAWVAGRAENALL